MDSEPKTSNERGEKRRGSVEIEHQNWYRLLSGTSETYNVPAVESQRSRAMAW